MWLKSLIGRTAIIGVALVAGITVGTISFSPAIATNLSNQSQSTAPVFPKNENGQTYGSDLYCTSPETGPDLISAKGVDGTDGYVLSVDLYGVMPKTPQEALTQQQKAGSVRKIPLYAADGKTVIGTFNIKTGKVIQELVLDDS